MQRRVLLKAGLVSALGVQGQFAHAQAWPERVVTMVYPYAAGGAADVFGHALADRLRKELGQPVIAESKPGAGGAIGCAAVARARPDGYTLLLGATGATLVTPFAMDNPGYDPVKDFESIALLTRQPMTFIVHPQFPARTLREAADLIRSSPGRYNYASAGAGALAHLGMEYFKIQAGGLDMVHVPYKGGAPAMNDVMAGHVPMLLENLSQVAEAHKAGRVRALAVLAGERSLLLPDVPTGIEQGFANLEVQTSYVLMAPARTPEPVLARLEQASRRIVTDPEFLAFGQKNGIDIHQRTSREIAATFVRNESAKWSRVIRSIGFKVSAAGSPAAIA